MWYEFLFYVGWFALLVACTYLVRRVNIQKSDLRTTLDVLHLMNLVNKQVNYSYQDELQRIMEYCVEVVQFVEKEVFAGDFTYDELFDMILNSCDEICEAEGIEVNDDLKLIFKLVAGFIANEWLNKDVQ